MALALVAIYLVWGGTYLGNRVALESVPPLTLTASRFLAAALLLLGAAAALGRPVWPGAKQVRSAALVGLILVGGGSSLLSLGQQYVQSGLTSLLIASTPLWSLLVGFVLGARPSKPAIIGVIAGFLGLILLVGASVVSDVAPIGVLILLTSTLTWAIGSTVAQRVDMPSDPLVSSAWQMLVGGTLATGIASLAGEANRWGSLTITGQSALAWVGLTVLSTAIGYSCYGWLLQNTTVRVATTYAYVNPVVAVALGVVILGERLAWTQIPGSLLILAAVAMVLAAERASVATTDAAVIALAGDSQLHEDQLTAEQPTDNPSPGDQAAASSTITPAKTT